MFFPNHIDTTVISGPDHRPKETHPGESIGSGSVADKKRTGRMSTISATAALLLRGIRDSADVFIPLKSVAGGLYFILENCEVWFIPCVSMCNVYGFSAYKSK